MILLVSKINLLLILDTQSHNSYQCIRFSFFLNKGKGVFMTIPFKRDDFILQYKGETLSSKEGEEREKQYSDDEGTFYSSSSIRGKLVGIYYRSTNVKYPMSDLIFQHTDKPLASLAETKNVGIYCFRSAL